MKIFANCSSGIRRKNIFQLRTYSSTSSIRLLSFCLVLHQKTEKINQINLFHQTNNILSTFFFVKNQKQNVWKISLKQPKWYRQIWTMQAKRFTSNFIIVAFNSISTMQQCVFPIKIGKNIFYSTIHCLLNFSSYLSFFSVHIRRRIIRKNAKRTEKAKRESQRRTNKYLHQNWIEQRDNWVVSLLLVLTSNILNFFIGISYSLQLHCHFVTANISCFLLAACIWWNARAFHRQQIFYFILISIFHQFDKFLTNHRIFISAFTHFQAENK